MFALDFWFETIIKLSFCFLKDSNSHILEDQNTDNQNLEDYNSPNQSIIDYEDLNEDLDSQKINHSSADNNNVKDSSTRSLKEDAELKENKQTKNLN